MLWNEALVIGRYCLLFGFRAWSSVMDSGGEHQPLLFSKDVFHKMRAILAYFVVAVPALMDPHSLSVLSNHPLKRLGFFFLVQQLPKLLGHTYPRVLYNTFKQ